VVELLLATGNAEIDLKNICGQTPLSLAAKNGNDAVIKLLLATNRADVDSKDDIGWTPALACS
jgi:ankyrin repeat protein